MRISDWSSDVCSSDLTAVFLGEAQRLREARQRVFRGGRGGLGQPRQAVRGDQAAARGLRPLQRAVVDGVEERRLVVGQDRKSVVEGKRVAIRLDLGGLRIIKKTHALTVQVQTH